MNMVLARMIAEEPQRHDADALAQALDAFRRELERVEAHALEAERLRTLGGIPPQYTVSWDNEQVVPAPFTASDERMAPPRGVRRQA